jgi:predicted O-methyltransferase YrrM
LTHLPPNAPFKAIHSADVALARCCYAACRALKPDVVVETGVAYGVTSAFLLQALNENGQGRLASIDLPPLGPNADQFAGIAVPMRLRGRWRLHRGVTKRLLPGLLDETGPVDLFVHDSLHTYRNMRWEFETVWPHLGDGGMVIADDVQGNPAFKELRNHSLSSWHVFQEADKSSLFGVAIK